MGKCVSPQEKKKRFTFQSSQNTHQSKSPLNIKKKSRVLLTSTIHIWQSESNTPSLTWLDLAVNLKTNFPHTLQPPTLCSPPPWTGQVRKSETTALPFPKGYHRLCFIPKRSWVPSLAQNKSFGEHWTYWRFTQGYKSGLTGFWLWGRAQIAFARILYMAHLDTKNCGQQCSEALLLPSQHSRFYASSLSIINIQLCQYLYTELNIYPHFTEKLSSSPRHSEWVCGKYKGWTASLLFQWVNFIPWLFAGLDIGIINRQKKGAPKREGQGETLIQL